MPDPSRAAALPNSYLLVVGEREALGWILREQRMAFRARPRALRDAAGLTPGSELLIYTSRSCFRNPSRDRGRVIAEALVTSEVSALDPPLQLAGDEFATGCTLSIQRLAPFGTGVDLGQIVAKLSFPHAWAIHLRRTLVPLSANDALTLRTALSSLTAPIAEAFPTYADRITPVRNR